MSELRVASFVAVASHALPVVARVQEEPEHNFDFEGDCGHRRVQAAARPALATRAWVLCRLSFRRL